MERYRRLMIWMICAWVVSMAAGIRFHLQYLPDYLQRSYPEVYRLDLTNGNSITGALVRRTPDTIYLRMGSGTDISFAAKSIRKMVLLKSDTPEGRRALRASRTPHHLVTIDAEKNIVTAWQRLIGKTDARLEKKLHKNNPQLFK